MPARKTVSIADIKVVFTGTFVDVLEHCDVAPALVDVRELLGRSVNSATFDLDGSAVGDVLEQALPADHFLMRPALDDGDEVDSFRWVLQPNSLVRLRLLTEPFDDGGLHEVYGHLDVFWLAEAHEVLGTHEFLKTLMREQIRGQARLQVSKLGRMFVNYEPILGADGLVESLYHGMSKERLGPDEFHFRGEMTPDFVFGLYFSSD